MYASGSTRRAKISRIIDIPTTIKNIFRHGKRFDDEPGTRHKELKRGGEIRFRGTIHCLPQRLKSTFFCYFFRMEGLFLRGPGVKKFFQRTLILVFEVIMQPPKYLKAQN